VLNGRAPRSITRGVEARYVIFDLDDTLVHSDAVRAAFGVVAEELGVACGSMSSLLDAMPGRPAFEIFLALGLRRDAARAAAGRFLSLLHDLNAELPTVAYPDAAETLRALEACGSTLMLSTGSSPARAARVLEQEGWDAFSLVLGSDRECLKGADHYEQIAAEATAGWTSHAATIGDSPRDMRLGAEHGVPIRIGIDRDGDASALVEAGATHVVATLSDILPILAAAA
jgi:phosphoglycolate phosphatase-like HAD superfamily hydrolase